MIFLFALFSLSSGTSSSCADYPSIEYCTFAGCDWVETKATTCLGPDPTDCSSETTPAGCETVKGCVWSAKEDAYCGSPDTSTCNGSPPCSSGCTEYPASGFCAYPSSSDCEKLSSKSSCDSNLANGCRWKDARALCEYQRPNCKVLDEATCSTKDGCYMQTFPGACESPSSSACHGYTTSGTCPSDRGCKWFSAGGRCGDPDCKLNEADCNETLGCEFGPRGNCITGCVGESASECNAKGSGCDWIPKLYQCSLPQCDGLELGMCSDLQGCQWKFHGTCTRNEQCSDLSDTECNASGSGCNLFPAKTQCIYPDDDTCSSLNKSECQEPGSGCLWDFAGGCWDDNDEENDNCMQVEGGGACDVVSSHPNCSWHQEGTPSCKPNTELNCPADDEDDPTKCSTESDDGCVWRTVNSRCDVNWGLNCYDARNDETACDTASGCTWQIDEGYCSLENGLECEGIHEENSDACNTTSGCQLEDIPDTGKCILNESRICETKEDESGCTGESDSSCVFEQYLSSQCHTKNGLICEKDASTSNECSSKNGCLWIDSTAHCGVSDELDCDSAYDNESMCDSRTYCEWRDSWSECVNGESDEQCNKHEGKTVCDGDIKCKWNSYPQTCDLDRDSLKCDENDLKTGCSTSSSTACKWIGLPAYCREDEDLNCVNNSTKDGCNMTDSSPRCVWHKEKPGSCGIDEDFLCTAKEGSTECSEMSTFNGCETRNGQVGSCKEKSKNDGSSIVSVPLLVVLLWLVMVL